MVFRRKWQGLMGCRGVTRRGIEDYSFVLNTNYDLGSCSSQLQQNKLYTLYLCQRNQHKRTPVYKQNQTKQKGDRFSLKHVQSILLAGSVTSCSESKETVKIRFNLLIFLFFSVVTVIRQRQFYFTAMASYFIHLQLSVICLFLSLFISLVTPFNQI